MTMTAVDTVRPLRDALAHFPAGLVALSAMTDDGPQALVASSFSVGISEDPPLVLFSIQKSSSTWPKMRNSELIGVSVIGEGHNTVCRQLASRDARKRLHGIDTVSGAAGDIYVSDSPLWLTCSIYEEVDAGDHVLNLMRVEAYESHSANLPLVFHRSSFTPLAAAL